MVCRLHPGRTPQEDAEVLFIPTIATEHRCDISGYLRGCCHAGPFDMKDVHALPRSTHLGKRSAWQIFQNLPLSNEFIDITMDWPWLRLVANTSKSESSVVGDGIRCVLALRKTDISIKIQLVHVCQGGATLTLSRSRRRKVTRTIDLF